MGGGFGGVAPLPDEGGVGSGAVKGYVIRMNLNPEPGGNREVQLEQAPKAGLRRCHKVGGRRGRAAKRAHQPAHLLRLCSHPPPG